MKITNFREHPEKCYHFNIDGEYYDGFFIEVKVDDEMYSAYLCSEMWPREKVIIYYNRKDKISFEEFMEIMQLPITEAYIRHVMNRMCQFEKIDF